MEQFITAIQYTARGIEYVGVLIVAGAALWALVRILTWREALAAVRRQFAEWIQAGLEFIIAAEIIAATLITSQQELLLLGAVVVIRVLLGYALKRELA